MSSTLSKVKELHKFFVKESYHYMKETNRVAYYLRYPIAYTKFMYYSLRDLYIQSKQKQG